MTNTELLAKIKAEIESLKSIEYPCDNSQQATGFFNALDRMTDFLSTLESEKPINQEEIDLKKELHDFIMEFGPAATFDKCASRFYDLGCRRTAEKYDEIEYNRQRAEESVPNDLEGAAKKHFKQEWKENYWAFEGDVINTFLAGAKWQAEQDKETIELAEDHAYLAGAVNEREKMMKEAVEAEILPTPYPTIWLDDCKDYDFKDGQKVRVIIIKEN